MALRLLRILTTIALFLAAWTLLPHQGASKPCLFGYKAWCSFAPGSTFILGMIALVADGIAKKIQKRTG